MSAWQPEQYARFREERRQPFFDLLSLLRNPRAAPGPRVVDLGCGTGELTAVLHQHVRASETLGIDASPEMLSESERFSAPGLRFECGYVASFSAQASWDIIFSNAALHWLPDHAALLERLRDALKPGGQLAFQVPANQNYPTHLVAEEVARSGEFADALQGQMHPRSVLPPEQYALLLDRLGFAEQHVRLQVYGHRLPSRDAVFEWVRGSLLSYYRGRLDKAAYNAFEARYRECLLENLEDRKPFFLTYNRILVWGMRPPSPE